MCLATTVLVLLVGPAPADAGLDLGANAALKDWQAFATLPGFTAAEKDKLTAECLTMPLDAAVAKHRLAGGERGRCRRFVGAAGGFAARRLAGRSCWHLFSLGRTIAPGAA
jgi:hypothetical protein